MHDAAQRYAPARRHYESAIDVARRLHDRRSEGQFLGYLGACLGRERCFDDARRSLDAAAQLTEAAADPVSLGLICCQRAEVEAAAGADAEAAAWAARANGIARTVAPDERSELGQALRRIAGLAHSGSRT